MMPMKPIPFDNSFARLGPVFSTAISPEPVSAPRMIRLNRELARQLGMDDEALDSPVGADIFGGNRIPDGAEPLAMVYAGHQFGGFSPQLGDGRAILLGEVVTSNGARHDIQLKGSGPTPFSRNGDGRAAMGPVLREYLLSEAMHRLGVPTTRALAAVATGDSVIRERMVPGAVITRVATSFVRVGTFEYFSAQGNTEAVKQLADYVIARNYPDAAEADNPYEALLEQVIERQAALIARWMQLGFIHGVMNTDNMSIAGETIDYGPCAFMDGFDHHQVYSSIDRQGRYAYANQPPIAQWNLIRFAETLLPLLLRGDDTRAAVATAERLLNGFIDHYQRYWLAGMRQKLGLVQKRDTDRALAEGFLDILAAENVDFTSAFRALSLLANAPSDQDHVLTALFAQPQAINAWLENWRQRLAEETDDAATRQQKMQLANPIYIPRNHLVEAVIRAAEDEGDFEPFHRLHGVLQQPFEEQPGMGAYSQPPRPEQVVHQTFCGT